MITEGKLRRFLGKRVCFYETYQRASAVVILVILFRGELEQAYNHIPKRERMPLFPHAAKVWLSGKPGLALKSLARYEQCIPNLETEFGKRLGL